jgi:DNA-binding transcriptional ArsR family regulator
MYNGDSMEDIEQVKKELKEELRAEMRQLRDELLKQQKPLSGPPEDTAKIAAEVRKLLSEQKEDYEEYTDFNPGEAAELLKPLANSERLKILQALYADGKYFTDMVELTGLEHSPLRFHLSSLMDAGYAEQERYRGRYLITVYGKIALRLVGFLHVKKGDVNE